jgi:hypothetical protein
MHIHILHTLWDIGARSLDLICENYIHVYMYIYKCICINIYIYIYKYI